MIDRPGYFSPFKAGPEPFEVTFTSTDRGQARVYFYGEIVRVIGIAEGTGVVEIKNTKTQETVYSINTTITANGNLADTITLSDTSDITVQVEKAELRNVTYSPTGKGTAPFIAEYKIENGEDKAAGAQLIGQVLNVYGIQEGSGTIEVRNVITDTVVYSIPVTVIHNEDWADDYKLNDTTPVTVEVGQTVTRTGKLSPEGKGPRPFSAYFYAEGVTQAQANVDIGTDGSLTIEGVQPGNGTVFVDRFINANMSVPEYQIAVTITEVVDDSKAQSYNIADVSDRSVPVGQTLTISGAFSPEGKGPDPFTVSYSAVSGGNATVTFTNNGDIQVVGAEEGSGNIVVYNTDTEETTYSIKLTITAAETPALTEVLNSEYGFGVNTLFVGQTAPILPAISSEAKNDVAEINYTITPQSDKLSLSKVGKLGGNLYVANGFMEDEVVVTAQAVDSAGANVGDALSVTLPVIGSGDEAVVLSGLSDIALGSRNILSVKSTGANETISTGFFKIEESGAIPAEYADSTWVNGEVIVAVEGSLSPTETIASATWDSPLTEGFKVGYAMVTISECNNTGEVSGIPCKKLFYVYDSSTLDTDPYDRSYGLGVVSVYKGQSVGLIPAIKDSFNSRVSKVEYFISPSDAVSHQKKVGYAENITIASDTTASRLTVTVTASGAEGSIGGAFIVPIDIEDAPGPIVNPSFGDNVVAKGNSVYVSNSVSGTLDEQYSSVRYETKEAIPASRGMYDYSNAQWVNGEGLINGAHEVITDASPMFQGTKGGHVLVTAQACTPQGELTGTSGSEFVVITG